MTINALKNNQFALSSIFLYENYQFKLAISSKFFMLCKLKTFLFYILSILRVGIFDVNIFYAYRERDYLLFLFDAYIESGGTWFSFIYYIKCILRIETLIFNTHIERPKCLFLL